MRLSRWIPTFLGFPLGGWLAVGILGSIDDPLTAGAGGALAGVVLGGAQWLALRSEGFGAGWIAATTVAMAAGGAAAAALTGSGTDLQDLVLTGVVVGGAVGATQAGVAHMDRLRGAVWTLATSGSWAIGWAVSTGIGVDVERGYVVFGASGALAATLLTGLALRSSLQHSSEAVA
jgi:hypothetical protein